MKEFTYIIEDPNGMHARPAGMLVTFAKRFGSDIRVKAGEKEADGKRLLSLMSLGAVHGTELTFRIFGEDEDSAATALEEFCRTQLKGGAKQGGNPSNEN